MPDITDFVTPADDESVQAALEASATTLMLKVTSWAIGGVARTMLEILAPVIRAYSDVNTEAIKGGFLDFATGIWLEALGEGTFDTPINDATFATTDIVFTNDSGDLVDEAAGDVVVSRGQDGPTYRTTASLYILPGDDATVSVTAEVIGSDSSAGADEINFMVTSLPGVTCTNPAAVLATDRELDPAYRARCRLARGAVSPNGPKNAYEYLALSAEDDDGNSYGITRVSVEADNTDGTVRVILADADGAPDGATVTAIDAILEEMAVPHGTDWLGADPAVEVLVPITYTAIARASDGLTEDDIEEMVEDALEELFSTWPIGGVIIPPVVDGVMIQDEIKATISQAQATANGPKPIIRVTLAAPAADVTLASDEVAKLSTITPTITLI